MENIEALIRASRYDMDRIHEAQEDYCDLLMITL